MSNPSPQDIAASMEEFVRLVTEHQWAIRGVIRSMMPGSSEVGDVLQETNIVLWKKRGDFQLGTNFLAWASSIARFEVLRHREKTGRRHDFLFSDALLTALSESESRSLTQHKLLDMLDGCIEQLRPKHRKLIEHRYTRGKSLEGLAQSMDTSAGSLRVILHRVRQLLKRCVENQLNGNPA